ncbi:Ribosomal L18 C-terminal region containing protein, putative [Leishmania lindenbergi]
MEAKVAPESIECMYKKAHAAIRADPSKSLPKKAKKEGAKHKSYKTKKMSGAEKRAAAKAKVAAIRERLGK